MCTLSCDQVHHAARNLRKNHCHVSRSMRHNRREPCGVSPGGTRCEGKAGAPARHVAMLRSGTLYYVQLVKIGEMSRAIGAFDQADGLNAQDPRPNEGL